MAREREFSDGELVPGTRYRVIAAIGSGGMGSVYEVEHEELGKRFVLKALLRSLGNREDLAQRLRNEWRALGRLEHPSIVSVTDAGVTTTGIPYYVMERLQGETLSARLRRERRLSVPSALEIAASVLDGLSAAHRIGIVHRDVKPPNIFLVTQASAKLLDFGIAKMLDSGASQITGRGVAIGTPRYMAPEQASGGTVDARTDLYATGLILFEMIAGKGPFDGAADANELFLAHLTREPPRLATTGSAVPAALDALLSRLLAKKPDDRPGDAAAVANDLRTIRAALTAPLVPAPARSVDDRTVPGGPFDTLESARTVSSEDVPARPASPSNDVTTRTGLGPPAAAAPLPHAALPIEDLAPTDAQLPAETAGATLRVEALEVDGSEAPTRTAALFPLGETPPPVEPVAPLKAGPSRSRWIAVAALAALVSAAVVTMRRAPERASPPVTAEAAARPAPEPAIPPAMTAPSTAQAVEPAPPPDAVRETEGARIDGIANSTMTLDKRPAPAPSSPPLQAVGRPPQRRVPPSPSGRKSQALPGSGL